MLRRSRGRLSVVVVCLLVSVPAFAKRSSIATTSSLATSPNPSDYGAAVTLTASVTAPSGIPSGSVTFKDGSTSLGSPSLNASGQATFTTSALAAGTHSLTAVYGGTRTYAGSTSAAISQTVNAPPPSPPSTGYKTAVWIAPWNSASLTSVQMNAGSLTESNPVWYSLTSSGSIVADATANSATWRAAMTGTLIVPTIQNVVNGSFSKTVVETIIGSATTADAHAQALTDLVVNNAYDGLDLDYEGLAYADRANFTAFVTTLATKLHAAGKLLSLTLSPKTSGSDTWDGPGADDYVALGAQGDSLKLMIYDYHWSTSAAGDITPLDWLDSVLTYAQSTIPNSKIIAGLPWYGYDWVGSSGTGVGYQQAMDTATANAATVTHDANGEATYTYSTHTVYFQDAYSYDQKVNVVTTKHAGIAGFTAWVAGDEDPAIWTRVAALKSGQ